MKKLTTAEFVAKAKSTHGDRYDYSQANYLGQRIKAKILCPVHGEFWQNPIDHTRGSGCPKCKGTRISESKRAGSESFISQAQKTHASRYSYSQVTYRNNRTPVKIICAEHGLFWQNPLNHVRGAGCPACAGNRRGTTENFIRKSVLVHGEKYDYSGVIYQSSKCLINIICPTHGIFEQSPGNHLMGKGCPKCANYGFNRSMPGIIYLLKIQTHMALFWKIGITNRTVEDRFRKDFELIQSGWIWHGDGYTVHQLEQEILKEYNRHKLNFLFPLLHNGGESECFDLTIPVHRIAKQITRKIQSPPEIFRRA